MRARCLLTASLLTTTMLTALPFGAMAQTTPDPDQQDEIVVTAQKRSEKLQNVPISIQALTTKKLDQLNITNFNQYAALLPSVSFQTSTPGTTNVYIRGVASGGDGNHSGSLPSVGMYLDEQPVTTIGGALDVHIYDVARIESLAGPQGTLYGASSEAGTIRIITNKPDTSSAYGRFDADVNTVKNGGLGHKLEGMYNLPISDNAAARFVGWTQHNAGYIDNIHGTREFLPVPGGIVADNADLVEDNYNTLDIAGGRAALKVDLSEDWTATTSIIAQEQKAKGTFGMDPSLGDLKVQHFFPEYSQDRFIQAALTLQGKIGDFDLTYAGAYMKRKINSQADYTDYAEAYDQLYSSVGGNAGYFYFYDDDGNTINASQTIFGKDTFTKTSHEIRLASPTDQRFRWVTGLFYQRQFHYISQDYKVPGLADVMSVNGHPETLWLTAQDRVDIDTAVFGEASFDITPALTLTAGVRAFEYDNSLIGFFGFGRNPDFVNGAAPNGVYGSSGVRRCLTTDTFQAVNPKDPTGTLLPAALADTPCTNLGVQNADGSISPKRATGDGTTYKLNLSWKAAKDALFYATVSRGFRPGGINRRSTVADYQPDYLTNTELGWKTTLPGGTVRFNGAIYHQDWKKFQFAFLGPNSFTEIHNGPDAGINGLEADVNWTPTKNLTITATGSFTDAKTKNNLCAFEGDTKADCSSIITTYQTLYDTGAPVLTGTDNQNYIAAPKGTRLPVTPKVKLAGSLRYSWDAGAYSPYFQTVIAYQDSASSDLRTAVTETFSGNIINAAALLGRLPSFTTVDMAIGTDWNDWNLEFYVRNLTDERGQITRNMQCGSCQQRPYAVVVQPMTAGVRLGSKF